MTLTAVEPAKIKASIVLYNDIEITGNIWKRVQKLCLELSTYVQEQENSANFFFMFGMLIGTMDNFREERECLTTLKQAKCQVVRIGKDFGKAGK